MHQAERRTATGGACARSLLLLALWVVKFLIAFPRALATHSSSRLKAWHWQIRGRLWVVAGHALQIRPCAVRQHNIGQITYPLAAFGMKNSLCSLRLRRRACRSPAPFLLPDAVFRCAVLLQEVAGVSATSQSLPPTSHHESRATCATSCRRTGSQSCNQSGGISADQECDHVRGRPG